jgi:transcriptional regulator with XRE-family HTH domain
LTQTEIAERAGVTRSRVSQMFSGSENPSVRALARFLNALDMEVDFIARARVRKESDP